MYKFFFKFVITIFIVSSYILHNIWGSMEKGNNNLRVANPSSECFFFYYFPVQISLAFSGMRMQSDAITGNDFDCCTEFLFFSYPFPSILQD